MSMDDHNRKIRTRKQRTRVGKHSFVNTTINPYPDNVEYMVSF